MRKPWGEMDILDKLSSGGIVYLNLKLWNEFKKRFCYYIM